MEWLIDGITDWIKQIFIDAIMASFSTMFAEVNHQVQDIAIQVGATPAGWNAGIFAMIRTLSETVVLPIAGMILTFVLCYELIQLVIEKNNLSDFDTFNIFKWIFRDPVRRQALVQQYNERFNSTRPREYDGAHIEFAGASPEISLKPHQRNAIARIIYGSNSLLAHEIGAEKSRQKVGDKQEPQKKTEICI